MELPNRATYTLRPLVQGDARLIYDWRNQPRVRSGMFSNEPLDWHKHLAWLENTIIDFERKSFHVLEGPNGPLGSVGFYNISLVDRRAEWTIYVGTQSAPPGTGMRLGYLAMEHAFTTLKLRKLSPQVLSSNFRSVAFHERLGFQHEGHLREHIVRDGLYESIDLFGMLEADWAAKRTNLGADLFAECGDGPIEGLGGSR